MVEETNILIIDDETGIIKSLEDFFTSQGYHVYSSFNAKNAYKILEHIKIHIVLCDILLPDINGMEIFRYISKNYPDIPVIILSVVNQEKLIKNLMKEGAFGYIFKPYNELELLSTVKNAIK